MPLLLLSAFIIYGLISFAVGLIILHPIPTLFATSLFIIFNFINTLIIRKV